MTRGANIVGRCWRSWRNCGGNSSPGRLGAGRQVGAGIDLTGRGRVEYPRENALLFKRKRVYSEREVAAMVFRSPRALNELGLSGTHLAGEAAIIDSGKEASIEGYIHNVVSFACIELIANGAMSVRREIKERGVVIAPDNTQHIARKVLSRPNQLQSGSELIGHILRDYMIFGTAYAEGSSVRQSNFKEDSKIRPTFWRIPPLWVSVHPGKFGLPEKFRVDHGKIEEYPVNRGTGDCDMVWWKRYHPTEHWKVVSPVIAAGRAVNTHNHASDIVDAQMRKGGLPIGFLAMTPEASKQHAMLSREQQQDMQDLIRRATEDGPGPNIPRAERTSI